ncbi:SIR2 family protein [Chloroflexi bacterium TSY]|nr:SIR2 family protein [Chloroflexi bacterium TSY]
MTPKSLQSRLKIAKNAKFGSTDSLKNPYVGSRTFTRQESDWFFGREREARELLSVVISERLVLFYAQSGAGKSSLLNTRLIPQLEKAEYEVLPIGRVGGELPEGVTTVDNIFTFNLLLSLDQSGKNPNRFAHMTIANFLANLTNPDGKQYVYDKTSATVTAEEEGDYEELPYVLIIDQFEELFTTHLNRWQDQAKFLRQLNQAMVDDPLLWVVLTLREDYIAALDPFALLFTDKMRARFYMERMDYDAALEAIMKPAAMEECAFTPKAAKALADNLRQVRVHGQDEIQLGRYVEPVQLQVVCYQLWEKLNEQKVNRIRLKHVKEAGDVDAALSTFYEQAIHATLVQTNVSEFELRNWFDQKLITEAGTRSTVFRGTEKSDGLTNQAVDLLVTQFLLRSERRAGGIWYELIHDRFIEPIRASNREWGGFVFEVEPLEIVAGEPVHLTWEVVDADEVRIDGLDSEIRSARGNAIDYPQHTTFYELTALRVGTAPVTSRIYKVSVERRPVAIPKSRINWDYVADSVHRERVLPVISNQVINEMLFGSISLAKAWADEVDYSVIAECAIVDVAQFLSVQDRLKTKWQYLEFLKYSLWNVARLEPDADQIFLDKVKREVRELTFSQLGIARLRRPNFEKENRNPLTLLASLPLPIYVTTSYHRFIEAALSSVGKTPKTQVYPWSESAHDVLPDDLTQDLHFAATINKPLVYHLHGIDDYPESLVLTEDDHLEFLVKIVQDMNRPGIIPSGVLYPLAHNLLLLLGYNDLQSWDSRVLFHGIIGQVQNKG